jgi:hypothetical protein
MDFARIVATAQFCVILLSAISCVVVGVFLCWAWWRSRKLSFVLLALANFAFLYVNLLTAVVFYAQLFHRTLLPLAVFDPLYAGQAFFGFIGTVLGFISIFPVVRLALIACSRDTPNQAMQPTADRRTASLSDD